MENARRRNFRVAAKTLPVSAVAEAPIPPQPRPYPWGAREGRSLSARPPQPRRELGWWAPRGMGTVLAVKTCILVLMERGMDFDLICTKTIY